jgi:hypothetical protein
MKSSNINFFFFFFNIGMGHLKNTKGLYNVQGQSNACNKVTNIIILRFTCFRFNNLSVGHD